MHTSNNYWMNRVAADKAAALVAICAHEDKIDNRWWAAKVIFVTLVALTIVMIKTINDGPTMYLTHALIGLLVIGIMFGTWKINR